MTDFQMCAKVFRAFSYNSTQNTVHMMILPGSGTKEDRSSQGDDLHPMQIVSSDTIIAISVDLVLGHISVPCLSI